MGDFASFHGNDCVFCGHFAASFNQNFRVLFVFCGFRETIEFHVAAMAEERHLWVSLPGRQMDRVQVRVVRLGLGLA